MKLSDFDFDLPEQLIATRPAVPRSASKLLVATPDRIEDRVVTDLVDYLNAGDVLVLNDTKVIPARLFGHRERAGNISKMEVTLLSPTTDGRWRALVKPLRKVRDGEAITFAAGLEAEVLSRTDGQAVLGFNLEGQAFDDALAIAGQMPLPPYIAAKRAADAQDKTDYQTVFAKTSGAVAAPTASLHFDDDLLSRLTEIGVEFVHVTLHVGAGTFLPVKVDDVKTHKMHAEWGQVSKHAAERINAAKAEGRRVIPVGTTALRLIESAATSNRVIAPWQGETEIFIYPGYAFRIADALMTNFHLPKSTLMMLVSALMGQERVRQIYDHAISQEYRFFSYGDSSLLLP
ncbi:S-adenosylmethionine:tRNA ribosyltransferase-isomerase [Litoreibacter ascidiaceicola]|uniref:S-adenosylmethionine:tRNA ribosyltransferase-isomerase n=1 Tax=Litoreibacter ascidiaceicola TaxID=1486859 RepID=A0A1M4VMZ5_9RHOB|nr:tRNA preQ1(34) S-adenosylmethionine ribosyltransferase-isomerase QueA [Litoreibacter ascidiaceicola]SHE70217.1 S-adenosylmethionine:tRNA ribosyltransferase-isomerase [Litoreibacter ascidiaceicola]